MGCLLPAGSLGLCTALPVDAAAGELPLLWWLLSSANLALKMEMRFLGLAYKYRIIIAKQWPFIVK